MQPSLFDTGPDPQPRTRRKTGRPRTHHHPPHDATCEICGRRWVMYPSTIQWMRAEAQALNMRVCKACRHPYRLQINGHRLSADNAVALIRATTCDYCGDRLPRSTGRAVVEVDHDHTCDPGAYSCGECVRGFVHKRCNLLIAQYEALRPEFDAIADYLTRSPRR